MKNNQLFSEIQKRSWELGERWYEKWYQTQLEFEGFANSKNPLTSDFSKVDLEVVSLNFQWYYEQGGSGLWERERENAVKRGTLLFEDLVAITESFTTEIKEILNSVESKKEIDRSSLKTIKQGFVLGWNVFLADLGSQIEPFLKKFLGKKGLDSKEIESVLDYCFDFKHPLGYQKEEEDLVRIKSGIPPKFLKKNSKFQDLPEEFKKLLIKHTDDFQYLTCLDIDSAPYSVGDFFQKMKHARVYSISGKKEMRRETQKKLDKNDMRQVFLIHRHIYLDNYVADLEAKLDFLMNRLISERYHISTKILSWYTFDELEKLVGENLKISEEEIKKRKAYRIMVYIGGKNNFLYGKSSYQKVKDLLKVKKTKFSQNILKGTVASQGYIKGIVKIINNVKDMEKMNKGDILVAPTTHPDLTLAIEICSGIITDVGGITSHAAIISREFNIPCIVGTQNATSVLKDGDFVELDAYHGIVKVIN